MTSKGEPVPTLDEIRRVVALELGVKQVRGDDRLVDDLGVESMDLVSILSAIEDRWGVDAQQSDLSQLATVADLHELIGRLAGRPQ
jgi:acyl carrier protein